MKKILILFAIIVSLLLLPAFQDAPVTVITLVEFTEQDKNMITVQSAIGVGMTIFLFLVFIQMVAKSRKKSDQSDDRKWDD